MDPAAYVFFVFFVLLVARLLLLSLAVILLLFLLFSIIDPGSTLLPLSNKTRPLHYVVTTRRLNNEPQHCRLALRGERELPF